jgi:hypothetical protein
MAKLTRSRTVRQLTSRGMTKSKLGAMAEPTGRETDRTGRRKNIKRSGTA